MTVEELDDLISIDYLYGLGTQAIRYNTYNARINHGNKTISSIEIDWENHEVNVWVKKENQNYYEKIIIVITIIITYKL